MFKDTVRGQMKQKDWQKRKRGNKRDRLIQAGEE